VGSEWLPRLLLANPSRAIAILSRRCQPDISFPDPTRIFALKSDIALHLLNLNSFC